MITCANQICLSRATHVVTRRKSIMFNSFLTINTTSLFFHNRRFETPSTKKDVTNEIQAWTRRIQVPPLPLATSKKSTASKASTTTANTTSKASLTLVKGTTTTSRPTSCAVVFESTIDVLQKNKARGRKRRVEELDDHGDTDNDMASTIYGGLGEDNEDEREAADVALSPLRPAIAVQMSKVSPLHSFKSTITSLLTNS
jgi:hypothetical protein